jgi:hypothetical protein
MPTGYNVVQGVYVDSSLTPADWFLNGAQGRLTYQNATVPRTAIVSASISINVLTGTARQYLLAIFKNGTVVTTSQIQMTMLGTSGLVVPVSTLAAIPFVNGDYVDVRIANTTDGTSCTVTYLTLTAK